MLCIMFTGNLETNKCYYMYNRPSCIVILFFGFISKKFGHSCITQNKPFKLIYII